jgi:prepilin-type N-terminal cleavage/methylation domain-containing protein
MRRKYCSCAGFTLAELVVVIAILFVVFFAVKSCKNPAESKDSGSILSFFNQPPPKSKDGFEFILRSLNSPNAHGAPLRMRPAENAKIVRRIKRFESYSISGREINGFIEVQLVRDRAVGWLSKDIISPHGRFGHILWTATKSFLSPMLNLKTILDIIVGVFLAFLIMKFFGQRLGGVISSKIDLATIAVAGFSTIFMQGITRDLIPFSLEVARMELGFARGALMVQGAFPGIIASLFANHLFGRSYEKLSPIENFFGVTTFFLMYLAWGYGAGWWV